MRARFLTLEGIDGAGKSTHLSFIADWLKRQGIDAVFTREPGGTPAGEKLRQMLLDRDSRLSLDTETLMVFASRQQLIADVIRPALEAGRWVVSDRFTDATFAYQGGGRGVPEERIRVLEDWVQQGLQPDLTLLLDVPQAVAGERMAASRELDRFEVEKSDFHQRVREAYLARAARYPRFCVLDGTRSIERIQADIAAALDRLIKED
ncbi:dTMP kinase [Paludibacterium paludis]|uniref:Thymidylate kinase n=1 Tax=Paludibacterium paludis TaxID=1225769 RepID=A0A918UBV4_9NEIS|nr:dTMP kinase [Paludibacterium paludis]GGY27431.1 thymidylate kinase [Paludibacterium paludis]